MPGRDKICRRNCRTVHARRWSIPQTELEGKGRTLHNVPVFLPPGRGPRLECRVLHANVGYCTCCKKNWVEENDRKTTVTCIFGPKIRGTVPFLCYSQQQCTIPFFFSPFCILCTITAGRRKHMQVSLGGHTESGTNSKTHAVPILACTRDRWTIMLRPKCFANKIRVFFSKIKGYLESPRDSFMTLLDRQIHQFDHFLDAKRVLVFSTFFWAAVSAEMKGFEKKNFESRTDYRIPCEQWTQSWWRTEKEKKPDLTAGFPTNSCLRRPEFSTMTREYSIHFSIMLKVYMLDGRSEEEEQHKGRGSWKKFLTCPHEEQPPSLGFSLLFSFSHFLRNKNERDRKRWTFSAFLLLLFSSLYSHSEQYNTYSHWAPGNAMESRGQ